MKKIVHLGFGNFHRAHQAWYTHCANLNGPDKWVITGVSMSRQDLADGMAKTGYAYDLGIRTEHGLSVETINVHNNALVATRDAEHVLTEISDPDTKIVTLTITEKGYNFDALGKIDMGRETDLVGQGRQIPQSAMGILAFGLAHRAKTGAPITILSCDNHAENGHKLAAAMADYNTAFDLGMASYLDRFVTFPNSMVDRITPATNDQTSADILAEQGTVRPYPVITEGFSEWVVEDNFASDRPDWAKVGVTIVDSVAPFELRKLRLLNASHSLLTYAGLLSGYQFVHEAIGDAHLSQQVQSLWDVAGKTLPKEIQGETSQYCQDLVPRFSVPGLRHELSQIAVDGSQKISIRVLGTMRDLSKRNQDCDPCISALGAWLGYTWSADTIIDVAADSIGAAKSKSTNDITKFCEQMLDLLNASDLWQDYGAKILHHTNKWISHIASSQNSQVASHV